jgi:dihydrolipoamide dehydrogenase
VPDDDWYSDDALAAEEVPDSIVIIGAGYIGLEFGYIFSCLGSKVSVIEKEGEVLPGEDRESAEILRRSLKRKGIKFYFSSEVIEIKKKNGNCRVFFRNNKKEEEIYAKETLIAIGRKPNVDALPREILEGDKVVGVNDFLETKIRNVYAIGDCRGGYLLAHSAFKDAKLAAMNILGAKIEKDDFAIPRVIYTEPEFASVGYAEEEVKEINLEYKVSKSNFAANSRAITMGKTHGYVKLIYDTEGNILGGTIVGENASELIPFLSLSIENKINVDSLSKTVFPHPTFSEIIGQVSSAALF